MKKCKQAGGIYGQWSEASPLDVDVKQTSRMRFCCLVVECCSDDSQHTTLRYGLAHVCVPCTISSNLERMHCRCPALQPVSSAEGFRCQ